MSRACVKWDNLWSNVFTIRFGVRQGSVPSPVLFAMYIDDVSKCSKFYRNSYVILYADDILLLASTIIFMVNNDEHNIYINICPHPHPRTLEPVSSMTKKSNN